LSANLKRVLKYLLFSGIAALFLYLAFRKTEWSKLLEDFQRARYEYVFLSMVMGYLAFVSRGLRWNLLLRPLGQGAKSWHAIHAISIGYFTNAIVPRAGEVARCTALHSTDKIPVNRLFGTVVLERVIDGLMLLSLVALTVLLQLSEMQSFFAKASRNDTPEERGFPWWAWVLLGLVVLLVVLYRSRHRFQTHPLYARFRQTWSGFKEGLRSLNKVENKWAFFAHTFFIWIMYYCMVYVVFFAFPQTSDIGLANGLFIMIVGGLGMVVPTPGGIGSYHYLVSLGLGVLGIDEAVGLSFATLVHGGQLIMTLIAGGLALALVYRIRRNIKKQGDEPA